MPASSGVFKMGSPAAYTLLAKRQAPIAKRQELGLTKAKMAQLLKVSGVSLYKWEKGSILPRSKQLDRVKVVLKMWPRQAQRAIAAE